MFDKLLRRDKPQVRQEETVQETPPGSHVKWAKGRAMEYLNKGDSQRALDSFVSDMNKTATPGVRTTNPHAGNPIVGQLALEVAKKQDPEEIRKFIESWSD